MSGELTIDSDTNRFDRPDWLGVPDLQEYDTDDCWPFDPTKNVRSTCGRCQGLEGSLPTSGRVGIQLVFRVERQENERSLRTFRPLALSDEDVCEEFFVENG